MRTMHPVLKRGGLFWDRELLPPSMYEARFQRVRAAITASGDGAWLVYGDVERYGAVAWFSNFLPRTRAALALVPRDGAPTLLLAVGQRDVPAAKTLTWIDDARPFSRLSKTLVAVIEEKGLSAARVGLVGVEELLPIKDWNEIVAAAPNLRTVSRTRDLAMLRARKDEHELEAIRRAAGVVARGFEAAAESLAPGRRMREITAEIERVIRAGAAEDVRVLVAAGEQSLRPADDRVLAAGDVVAIYVAAEVQRYWAEAARTFVIGGDKRGATAEVARGGAALAAMRALVRPGAAVGDIARAGETALGEAAASARAHGLGNGIGLDIDEYPNIDAGEVGHFRDDSALALRVVWRLNGRMHALGQTILLKDGVVEALFDPLVGGRG